MMVGSRFFFAMDQMRKNPENFSGLQLHGPKKSLNPSLLEDYADLNEAKTLESKLKIEQQTDLRRVWEFGEKPVVSPLLLKVGIH